MSLAAIVGILLNSVLPGEEKPVAVKVEEDTRRNLTDMKKLKHDIKEELTVELKDDILNEIKREMNKNNKHKR